MPKYPTTGTFYLKWKKEPAGKVVFITDHPFDLYRLHVTEQTRKGFMLSAINYGKRQGYIYAGQATLEEYLSYFRPER